ncbi:MAG: hypothetical protein WCG61_02860 [Chlorobium sp.]
MPSSFFSDPLWIPLNTNQDGVFLLSFNAHKPDRSAGAFSRCPVVALVGISPFSPLIFSLFDCSFLIL